MIPINLSSKLDPVVQRFTRAFVSHTLARCDPGSLVLKSIDFNDFDTPTHVLAFGKASAKMALSCENELGPRFAGGVVLSPDDLIPQPVTDSQLRYYGVDHPSPTPRNVAATDELVGYARSIPSAHGCIVCISGGGSAHLCSPKSGVSLEHIIETTSALNARGATIHELNEARRSLEILKAGGLAEILAHVHSCKAVVLSDVLDDDLSTIASGPMMNSDHPIEHTIIGNHATALLATQEFVEGLGLPCGLCKGGVTGESSDRGQDLAEIYRQSGATACLFAGETTVDTRGSLGRGGPCIELALDCALNLAETGFGNWITLGLATDGIDGPTDAAGAIITSEMLRAPERQLNASLAIESHNTLPFLDSIGATVRTGPTGTNLNDLCMVCPIDALGGFKVSI